MANLFALSGQNLLTPQMGAILPGIIRGLILDLAPGLGLSVFEKNLHPRDLLAADLVFSTNSVRFITMITMIDDTVLNHSENIHYLNLKDALKERLRSDTSYRM